ncbi:MAG: hypothetical protein KAW81_04725 [Dehalococcoidia bacterium]|nr:hypothetical protein [Dehalococcoidia bacterium]
MADDQQNSNQNDQVTKEEFDALKVELEAEKAKSQEAVAKATQELTDRVTSLEADLASKDTQIGELTTQAESQSQEVTTSKAALESAVGAYKDVVLKANPLIPTDMIQGLAIDEVNASLEKATNLVGQIKQGLEKEGSAEKIPPGAPQRTGPDLSAMTTKEKINYGLREAQEKTH